MPGSLSLAWGQSVHFAKFPILRFSKRYFSNNFHQIPSKRYEDIAYHWGRQAITLLGNRHSLAQILTLELIGKHKLWNISIRADRGAKRITIVVRRTKRKLWYFDIFLNTGPYAAGHLKVLFLPQFSLELIQTL